jgi:uncharacterized GH25 family protein
MKNNIFSRHALALAAAALLLPLGANAHRTWLMTNATVVEGKTPSVTVDAAVSEDLFEYDTNALQLDAVTITAPDGTRVNETESRSQQRRRTSFEVKLTQPGTYRIAGVTESVMASYKAGAETKRFRGTAEAFAKEVPADAPELQVTRSHARVETFVSYDKNALPAGTTGVGLELVPLTPPTDLSSGDVTKFRLLLDGKPVANSDVTVVRGGGRYRYKMGDTGYKTDAQGEFSVKWDEAGRYWLGASWPARVAAAPGAGAPGAGGTAAPATPPAAPPAVPRRASYSGTFEVLPK